MMLRAVVLMAAAALGGCGAPAGNAYPQESREGFVRSCEKSGAPAAVCHCILQKLEASYSFAEFAEWDKAVTLHQDHPMTAVAKGIVAQCSASQPS